MQNFIQKVEITLIKNFLSPDPIFQSLDYSPFSVVNPSFPYESKDLTPVTRGEESVRKRDTDSFSGVSFL